jgi:hypothetical protein
MGTLRPVTVQMQPDSQSRRRPDRAARRPALRAGAVSAGLLLGSWAASASAAPPEGWENSLNQSMLSALLKLVGIPLLVAAIVTLLVYLPSMMRRGRGGGDPATYFSDHSEWFGGPRTSPEAVESGTASGEHKALGGASARW